MKDDIEIRQVKVSELPESESFDGLYTLGVDKKNKSVKVSLQEVGEATDSANSAADKANSAAETANLAADKTNEVRESVETDIEEIRTIAEGTVKALAFDTEQQLNDWVAGSYVRPDGLTTDDLFVGQHLLILEAETCDYWWTGEGISPLKVGIDLTDYATKSYVNNIVGGVGELLDEALNILG